VWLKSSRVLDWKRICQNLPESGFDKDLKLNTCDVRISLSVLHKSRCGAKVHKIGGFS
jgi:hypothetical protein